MKQWSKLGFLLLFVGFAAVVLMSHEPPLLRDYPDWVYQGVLFAKLLTGHPVPGYVLKPYAVPNALTTWGIGLLAVVFAWQTAAKLWLVLYLVLAAAVALYAGTALRAKDEGLWWILPATVFLGTAFWYGTLNFNIGLCLLLLLACRLYREQEGFAAIVTLLALCFFAHLLAYASALLMVYLYCLRQRRWKLFVASLFTLPLALWYFAGRVYFHSDESAYGYSSKSHIAVSCVLVAVLLGVSFFQPKVTMDRLLAPLLGFLTVATICGALLTTVVPVPHLPSRLASDIFLLRLKALGLFADSGFIAIVYKQPADGFLSSTETLIHRPALLMAIGLSAVLGVAILALLARAFLGWRRRQGQPEERRIGFLWDFAMLFGVLYFVCPPNALGVIAIDGRMALIALGPAMFLMARESTKLLRSMAMPCVLMGLLSLYQFAASQRRIVIPGTETNLPQMIALFDAVDPIVSRYEYQALESNKLDCHIFVTGIFSAAKGRRL